MSLMTYGLCVPARDARQTMDAACSAFSPPECLCVCVCRCTNTAERGARLPGTLTNVPTFFSAHPTATCLEPRGTHSLSRCTLRCTIPGTRCHASGVHLELATSRGAGAVAAPCRSRRLGWPREPAQRMTGRSATGSTTRWSHWPHSHAAGCKEPFVGFRVQPVHTVRVEWVSIPTPHLRRADGEALRLVRLAHPFAVMRVLGQRFPPPPSPQRRLRTPPHWRLFYGFGKRLGRFRLRLGTPSRRLTDAFSRLTFAGAWSCCGCCRGAHRRLCRRQARHGRCCQRCRRRFTRRERRPWKVWPSTGLLAPHTRLQTLPVRNQPHFKPQPPGHICAALRCGDDLLHRHTTHFLQTEQWIDFDPASPVPSHDSVP